MYVVVFPPPGTKAPPPCYKTKHRPWDGHYVWIHDVHTSVGCEYVVSMINT